MPVVAVAVFLRLRRLFDFSLSLRTRIIVSLTVILFMSNILFS